MADGTNPASQFPNLPERIRGLERLSYNLWWSWHRQARDMFPSLDLQAWRESDHNPLRMLAMLPQQTLDEAARDPEFLERFDAVMAEFDAEHRFADGMVHGRVRSAAVHACLFFRGVRVSSFASALCGRIGSAGRGLYQGMQRFGAPDGGCGPDLFPRLRFAKNPRRWLARGRRKTLDRTYDPVRLVRDGDGEPLKVLVPFFDPPVHVLVWRADIGRVPVYLLDTEIESNQPWDRAIGIGFTPTTRNSVCGRRLCWASAGCVC